MNNTSPFTAMQRAETQLKVVLRAIDPELLSQDERKALVNVRKLSADARLDIRDYELSETRLEQVKCAVAAKNRLSLLQANILAVGSVFGPADVAQLSAQLEQINGWLE